ncbi:AER251Wp [Eremothecium gossypii ATCC 10895]|uniref:Protein ESC2 n=1 Tax=Eremothecium gossypii (strain ATCC 10895 / CBS 109.51 / FGSC 9923 / NRRL Y-1056) TaxID=284811 RepID=ESC2_EREGS|nr:AER251Wp [Eremothecium gossypii ATCC 10895]Q756K3.1 RecName: Full=Protein ESC2; AltName: Full=Establishes silent chromatin protein 2 [Eremothecium gossypii ATCC 10895]AAS52932.1 AER251Wp [Eremothecium gossypii ATCC 10895]AEY97240.1 FAER251Wp [Eremothecium gossypii FDAG1]
MGEFNEYDDIDDFFCNDISPLHDEADEFGSTDIALPSQLYGKGPKPRAGESKALRDRNKESGSGTESEAKGDTLATKRGRSSWRRGASESSRSSSLGSSSPSDSSSGRSLSPVRPAKRKRTDEQQPESEANRFLAEMERDIELSAGPGGGETATGKGGRDTDARVYNVGFISRIEGSRNRRVNVKVTGQKQFATFLAIALAAFSKQHNIRKSLKPKYQADQVKIYREGVEVFKFMTCDSFNIEEPYNASATDIEVYIVPVDEATAFEQEWKRKFEERVRMLSNSSFLEVMDDIEDDNDDFLVNEYEKALVNARSLNETELAVREGTPADESSQLLKIVLLGSDNKKVFIHVRPTTTLLKVAEHYRVAKELPPTVQLSLMFDHEEIDLDDTICNIDIEDGDIIEVVVK